MHIFRALILLSVFLTGAPARADLSDDAGRLARIWSARGARVERLAPIFVEHGHIKAIAIGDERPPGGAKAEAKAAGEGCTTLALLAPRTADFLVDADAGASVSDPLAKLMAEQMLPRLHPPTGDQGDERRLRSASGAAMIVRCGARRAELRRALIELTSSRAAIEVIVARSREPLGDIRDVLPERSAGLVAPRGDPGRPIEPGPLAERLARAERRARTEGADSVLRVPMRASSLGAGELSMRLAEGCHRLEVMAEVPSTLPRRATDIDAEAREADSDRSLSRDRADAPDARLDFCLGEASAVEVPFMGAAGAVNVVVSDAHWAIPRWVPSHWGSRARGGFAAALRRRNAPEPRSQPIVESIGVQGDTNVAIDVEPGRCYLAATALLRGETRGMRLSAEIGGRSARDESGERLESTAIAFCSEAEPKALLRVEVRGSSPWWVLVVWPMN